MSDLGGFEEALDEAVAEGELSKHEALKRAIVALAEANGVDVPGVEEISELESRVEAVETAAETTSDDGAADGSEAIRDDVDELRTDVENLRADVDELHASVEEVTTDVEELTADVDEKVQDLRERVVRIYREAEGKAPADHDHPEIVSAVEDLRATVEELRTVTAGTDREPTDADGELIDADGAVPGAVGTDVDDLTATIDDLTATVGDLSDRLADLETGSETFAERLESIEGTIENRPGGDDDVSEKLSRIASAVVGVQRRLRTVERRTADAETLARLTSTANEHGIRKAACEHCGESVRLSLLSKPRCPHCDRDFSRLEPKSGFFGTSRLTVGDPPALEGRVADTDRGSGTSTERSTADGSGKR